MPVIGITCHMDYSAGKFVLSHYYVRVIECSSGIPFILPVITHDDLIDKYSEILDGLLLTGGVDVDPLFFGEQPRGTREITPERDVFEMKIVRKFMALNKPILGICRGMQVLNIAAEGSIFQDINDEVPGVIKHMQEAPRWHPTHTIEIVPGTKLGKIYKKSKINVNTFHHQAVKEAAPGFCISALAADGIIEAIESSKHKFVIGVQWHPEHLAFWDKASLRLFKAFIEASSSRD
ncbi:MAG TPA: peptidase C26 [Peptococcaceae bacterium]|nr:peptidase C26 [Peptococcaceae bacterium]